MFPFIILFGLGYVLYRAGTDDTTVASAGRTAPALPPAQHTQQQESQPPLGAPSVPVEVAMAIAYESDVNKLEALARKYDRIDQVIAALIRQRIAFLQAMGAESTGPVSFVPEQHQQQVPAQFQPQFGPFPVVQPQMPMLQPGAFAQQQFESTGQPIGSGPAFETTGQPVSVSGGAAYYDEPRPHWLPSHVPWPPVIFNPTFHNMG